jgi:hypothetical protein
MVWQCASMSEGGVPGIRIPGWEGLPMPVDEVIPYFLEQYEQWVALFIA